MQVESIKTDYSGVRAFVGTDIGRLELVFTREGHACVSTPNGGFVTVRDKEYDVSAHLFAEVDWQPKPESDGGYVSVAKRHYAAYSQSQAAPTIAQKVIALCRLAVLAVLEKDPDALRRAEINHATIDLGRRQREIAELAPKLAECEAQAATLRARIAELTAQAALTA